MTHDQHTGKPGHATRCAASAATRPHLLPPIHTLRHVSHLARHTALALFFVLSLAAFAQMPQPTGTQQLAFAGLRAATNQGQINSVLSSASGNLYLLIDQKDGVRLLETDSTATSILAQAQLGAKGDIGLAMALDPSGNVYVAGTTSSGLLVATPGAAFPAASGSATNSFVARFDSSLNPIFVTFTGGATMAAASVAATSDAVFLTGTIYAATLPVTPAGILQTPAYASTSNGFVEKFSSSGSTLLYATYLTGASGSTSPVAIAADAQDNAYIAGSTTSPGYPTIAALVPEALGATSGFLTKLTPAGDGIVFSTYIPGSGITSLALDPGTANLLLSGSVSLGQFPVATVSAPLAATPYQVLLRLPLDGSSVLASTVLAPGTQSFVAAAPGGTAWVDGSLTLPIFPLTPLSTIGNSFAMHVNAAGLIDQTARLGGIATSNPTYAGAPVTLTAIAVDAGGNALLAGSFAPFASQSLLATQTFDLPLASAPTPAFPSAVRAAVPPTSTCNGSLCSGSAAYLAKLVTAGTLPAALALSVDDAPNLTLRNLSTAQATSLQINATGFTFATNCLSTLPAGGECSIALTGSGPGSVTVQAANATTQTASLPALPSGAIALPVVFTPKQLDFGIVSSASGAVVRTLTVTNLAQQSQTFASALDIGSKTTLPYTIAETASDCTLAGVATKLIAPGASCHITLGLTASTTATNDGILQQYWKIGSRDIALTAITQAAAVSVSAPEIDFGTQYTGGLRTPRYLYLSNSSTSAISHAAVTLPATSPFSVVDGCPGLLEPLTVCQLQLTYQNAHVPSADATTLALDQGLSVLIAGKSLPPPTANGAAVNPNLSVSATALNFPNSVVVTGISSSTQTLTIRNTGASAFTLGVVLTGDFTQATNCGATLAGGASCTVVVTFAPSQPGTRQGMLAVTAGAGTTPAYITLSGVGIGILSPPANGTLDFGGVAAGEPVVQWYKITQPFTALSIATASSTLGTPFSAVLVEDIGYGHGQPPSTAFTASASGTCLNCWLGVRFTPASTGLETGTLAIASAPGGSPYVLALTGTGLPLTGLLLTPSAQDFGPIPIHSASAPALFTVTNLVASGNSIQLTPPIVTGDFTLSNAPTGGAPCGGTLAYAASCFIEIAFAPTASGPRTGTLTLQAGATIATAALTGYGSTDPGLSLVPAALTFQNVPGATSAQQSITLTNTSTDTEQIAAPLASTSSAATSAFSATTNCGTLAPGGSCSIAVVFTPAAAPSAGVLQIPVTAIVSGAPVTATYSVPLTGAYTTEDSGIQILPAQVEYGPLATGSAGTPLQIVINNLTAKSLALSIALPRQFVLAGPPCSGLAPNASCTFSVAFLPLTNGDITGTLFAQATPTDGSATLNGLGYVEGYGVGAATLAVTGNLMPGRLLNFGQVPSGQSTQQVLTLSNPSATVPLNIRRITSGWPFLSTTTCGAALAPGQSCTVTLAYTPLNQVSAGSNPPPSSVDSGTLIVESDALSSPDLIDLAGASTPAIAASPGNTAPIAAFTPSQSSLTFANAIVGNVSAPQTLTLDNTGTVTLTISNIQTTPDFTVASNCSTILPGASCTLTVTFTPQNSAQPGSGARTAAIEITSNASTSLEFISLSGVSSASSLVLGQNSLNFGTVLVGANAALSVQITNSGAASATFTVVTATGDYAPATSSCPPSGGTLAPGATCSVQVLFTPTLAGTRTGTLAIATSTSTLPLTIPLTGVGVQSHLQIAPVTLSFGSIAVGSSASLSFTLVNTGSAPITGIALSVTGDYTVFAPCGVTALAPGGSCSVTIAFAPAAAGARAGTLAIASSDPTSPASVPLTGNGVAAGAFMLTAASNSASVASGAAATYSLSVTPLNGFTGPVVLNCTPVVAASYAYCSLLPSSITLGTTSQTAIATLTTVTTVAFNAASGPHRRSFGDTALCLLFPAIIFTWKARTSRHNAWRRVGPIAWAIMSSIALLTAGGCGGSSVTPSNLRFAPSGSYQYQVTASATSGGQPITRSITLNLTVQ
jgi:hypothetical protein